ncbi:exosortase U [Alienimonas sp. DA493]|uniref:exosortase U n=1 Tax=Alienimonas sp. DA493 TaxID=3373605 RepID=UPI0037547DA4
MRRWLPLAAAGAAAIAFGPLLVDTVARLWESPRFGHAPIIWAAAAAIGWYRLREDRELRRLEREAGREVAVSTTPRPVPELLLWTAALLPSVGAVWLYSPWLTLIAAFLAVPATIYSLGGRAVLRPVLPAWAAIWTTLPPPFDLDEVLVLRLQRGATGLASSALDLLGRRHLPAGVTVELPGRSYFVEEACSGVNSLYALLAVTALGLAWARRGWPRWLILLPAAIVWAVAANAVRVTAAVELSAGYGLPVAEGIGHDVLGALTFALALGLTLSTDTLLALIVPPRADVAADDPDATEAAAEPAAGWFPRTVLPRPAVWGTLAVLLLVTAGWGFTRGVDDRAVAAVDAPDRLKPAFEDSLPETWNGWRRVGFRNVTRDSGHIDGAYSSVWSYRRGNLRAEVSMDGPFADGWHDLQICYTHSGWNCTDAVDRVTRSDAGEDGSAGDVYTRLDLEQPLGRRGVVFFTSYAMDDDKNLGPDPAARMMMTDRYETLRDLLPAGSRGLKGREPGYQVQTYAPTYRPLSEEEVNAVRDLFHEMRGRLAALPHADPSHAAGRDARDREPSA